MPQFLDYATPRRSGIDFISKALASLPLSLGLIVYALLCTPAATQRGYPPIDPLWDGVTYLWVFPACMFVLCWPAGLFSKRALLLYAIASGYIDACTVVGMVPHRFSAIGALLPSVIYIPLHIAGVGAIAAVSRFAGSLVNSRAEEPSVSAARARRICIFAVIISIAAVFPAVYRRCALYRMEISGRERADADWAQHSAVIKQPSAWYTEHAFGDFTVTSYFDSASGLPLRCEMHGGYESSYEKRIQQLLQLHGIPQWSQKSRFVADADLVGMLADKTMTPVTAFPFDAAPGITLLRNCSSSRWGGTASSGSNDLSIDSKFSGLSGTGGTGNVYVGRLKKYPQILFVRCGDKQITACSDDGWILGYAIGDEP